MIRRPRLAIVAKIWPKKLGSFEDYLLAFAIEMQEDHDVTLVTYGPVHPAIATDLASHRVNWIDLQSFDSGILGMAMKFGRRFDVVHLSLFAPRESVAIAASMSWRSKIIFQDCFSTPLAGTDQGQSLLSQLLDRVTFFRVARLSAVSQFVAGRDMERFGIPASRVSVVYNGASVRRFRATEDTAESEVLTLLCVASLTHEKGVDTLLHAYARLDPPRPMLRLVGEGPDHDSLRDLARRLGVSTTVTFVGLSDRVDEEMRNASIVIHPARWGEAFGLTIAEAMASSRALIASSVGAIPELIEHDVSGLLVQPDNPIQLASALRLLVDDRERRSRLAAAARTRATELFSLERWVRESIRLVRDVSTSC